jgi:hypothetical protein
MGYFLQNLVRINGVGVARDSEGWLGWEASLSCTSAQISSSELLKIRPFQQI